MSPRILHFIDSGGLYGAEQVILNLSQEMRKYGQYTPVVGCIVRSKNEKNDLHSEATSLGIFSEKFVIRNEFFYYDLIKAAVQIRKMGISCIHSHGYKPSVYGFLIKLFTGIPVIATCHLWFLTEQSPLKYKIMVMLEMLGYRRFSHVVAVSEPIKNFLVNRGVPKCKVTIIKNGIPVDRYAATHDFDFARYREEFGIEQNSFIVLNIGRLTEQKAQHNIIHAARMLKKEGFQCQFLIVGSGRLKIDLQLRIREADLEREVKLLGFRKDIEKLLKLSDVFLLPSLDEGLPIALLEALASRVPSIVTPVGDIPKILTDKKSALFVRVNNVDDIVDAIKWMMSHRNERKLMADKAYRFFVKNYSSSAMYQGYKTIYDSILSPLFSKKN